MKRVLLLTAFYTGVVAAGLKLIPYPQSVISGTGELTLKAAVQAALLSKASIDRSAVDALADDLSMLANVRLVVTTKASIRPGITLGRAGDPAIDKEIARRGLDASCLNKPDSYVLGVDATGILIAARSPQGVFYGVQTLRQLLRPGPQAGTVVLPHVKIADWPALRYRGLSVDVSRGPILTEDQMRFVIRTLAEFKMNMLSLYMEHVFPYTHSPGVTPDGAEIAPELIQRLTEYAKNYHVELVPQQQMFGHLHHMLKFELYSGMAELPHSHVLAAQDEKAFEWVTKAATQLSETFPGTFLHIGSDETWELGKGRSRARADEIGIGNVYVERMERVLEALRPLKRRVMFWGDVALSHPELITRLPRDLVAMTWSYGPSKDFSEMIVPFRKNGMDVFVCPGINNWNRILPNYGDALVNINNFVRDGKKHGAIGMFNTDWRDNGEALFHMAWYPVVFSAAAAWQQGSVDVPGFDRAFDWAFYRHDGEAITPIIRSLNRAHEIIRSTGLGGASTALFWFDPFTRAGAEQVRKLFPVTAELRLLAERASIDLTAAAPKARKNGFTLAYLRFAAKRLDALGMRIQFAKEIGEIYRDATTGERKLGGIRQITWTNGRVEDLRDTVLQLRNEYRTLWLQENRPHFLDSVLLRYDREALYWLDKEHVFSRAGAVEQLGLVLP